VSADSSSDDIVMVALPSPPPVIRRRVARLVVELLARHALVDLGVLAGNDLEAPE
jgi:hypothetical protein